jgi:hypothetical protein
MVQDRSLLLRLAAKRRERTGPDGRPTFDLTADERERSAHTAMRLADASKSQVEARAGTRPTATA